MRYRGLNEFTKGHYEAARQLFEQALVNAQTHTPGGRDETMSAYDLAQVYQYMGKRNKESEFYYKRALTLAKKSYSAHSAETVLFLQDLATLLKSEHRDTDATRLAKEVDQIIAAHPDSNSIGAASVESDGAIQMYLQARDAGSYGHALLKYRRTDRDYKYTVLHLGPMKIGEQKFVLPYRDDPDAPPSPPAPPPQPPRGD